MTPLWLIVRREVTEKFRSRAFRIVNIVLLLIVLAATILPGVLGGDGEPDPFRVAAIGDDAATVLEVARTQGEGFGIPVEITDDQDEAAARDLLEEGELDAVLIGTQRLVVADGVGQGRRELLDSSRRFAQLDGVLEEAGLDDGARAAALTVPPLDIEMVGDDVDGSDVDPVAIGIGLGVTFMLYGLLIFYGQQVAQGLVQEKQSRVIEVLLAAVRPIDLLGGKLVGLGLLGLAQIALLVAAAAFGTQVSGTIEVPASALGGLAATLVWFLIGYALYATMFALTAAVVPKVEDLQTAMTVPILFLVGSIFLAQFALTDPDGTIAVVGALVPFSAPIVQPLLAIVGETSIPLAIGGAVSSLAVTAILVPIAARVHAGAALSTRTRISIRDALSRHDA